MSMTVCLYLNSVWFCIEGLKRGAGGGGRGKEGIQAHPSPSHALEFPLPQANNVFTRISTAAVIKIVFLALQMWRVFKVVLIRVNTAVILLPLRPASMTHKNPQRRKIIHGLRPVGRKVRCIDLNTFCTQYLLLSASTGSIPGKLIVMADGAPTSYVLIGLWHTFRRNRVLNIMVESVLTGDLFLQRKRKLIKVMKLFCRGTLPPP